MSRTALLLMDLQNGIVGRIAADEAPAYLERVKGVAEAARRAGIQVIYVSVKFREGFPEVSSSNKTFSMLKSGAMPFVEGNPAVEIHDAVKPEPNDILVTKRRVGAFSGSDLAEVLRGNDVDHIVLAGIATSGVVLSTLRLAADLDYKITVIADCCKDRDEEVHRVLTEKVFPNQADVMTSQEWEKSLATSAVSASR